MTARWGRLALGAALVAVFGCAGQHDASGTAPDLPAGPVGDGSTRPLRLATWNVEWLHRRDGTGEVRRWPDDYARLARYARRLDADVIALQEVDGEPAARRVFDPERYAFHFTDDAEQPQRAGFAIRRELAFTAHRDVVELARGRTRRGADVTVRAGERSLRLLSIHLKAGCWSGPLDSGEAACDVLGDQLVALERWIDARARDGVPFAVLGDFNRRLSARDAFWLEIDDDDPPGADLFNVTEGRRSDCWDARYPRYVDHIVLAPAPARWLVPGSFEQILFDGEDRRHADRLSDHCPIAVSLVPH